MLAMLYLSSPLGLVKQEVPDVKTKVHYHSLNQHWEMDHSPAGLSLQQQFPVLLGYKALKESGPLGFTTVLLSGPWSRTRVEAAFRFCVH